MGVYLLLLAHAVARIPEKVAEDDSEADDEDIEGADYNVEDGMDERNLHWQWCPRNHQKGAPFCIHAGTRPRECDRRKCCWKRGRGCLMRHYSSSSSVGAIILWVLLAVLLLGGGLAGGYIVVKKKGAVAESDDE